VLFLSRLALVNVRCHAEQSVTLGPGANVVFGPNGAGKTSLLEAAHILLAGYTPRGKMRGVIRRGSDYLRVNGSITGEGGSNGAALGQTEVAFACDRSGERRISQDGRLLSGFWEMRERLHSVRMFTPDDLRLIKGEPVWRRRFLDDVIGAQSPSHRERAQSYREALRQRNALLRRGCTGGDHQPWEQMLARLGPDIVAARRELLGGLSPQAAEVYLRLAGTTAASLRLTYRTNASALGPDDYIEKLHDDRRADGSRGFTNLGPHRDDVRFHLDELDLRAVGSQGEQRTAVLALLLAERRWSLEHNESYPLLLLDDVMSELDSSRRNAVMDILLENGQSIVTAAETGYFRDVDLAEAQTVELKG